MDDGVATEAPRISLEIEDVEQSILSSLRRRLETLQQQPGVGYAGDYRRKLFANAHDALEEAENMSAKLRAESLAIDSLLDVVDSSLRGLERTNN